jgi:putative thioredoxin
MMKDVSAKDFATEVIARSATVPVVVDFWAPWCGPCRVLGPVLEAAVAAMGGRVELAKINTDENQELAQQYQIQGIPAVKAFRDGKVVAEFVGAQPAPQIKRFLDQLAPPPGVAALASAEAAVKAGDLAAAEPQLRALLEDATAANRARLLLAGLLADANRADEARAQLTAIDPRSPEAMEIPAVERRLELGADAVAYGGEAKARADLAADPKNLEARYALASALAARGEFAEALEHFLDIAARNRKFKDDGARLAMLSLFDRLGPEHDLTRDFRRRLQIVL